MGGGGGLQALVERKKGFATVGTLIGAHIILGAIGGSVQGGLEEIKVPLRGIVLGGRFSLLFFYKI